MTTTKSRSSTSVRDRYKDLRFILLVAITCISLIPTTLLAILSYYQYKKLLTQEQHQFLKVYAHNVRQTFLPQVSPQLTPPPLPQDKVTTGKTILSLHSDPDLQYDACIVDEMGNLISTSHFFAPEDQNILRNAIASANNSMQTIRTSQGKELWVVAQHLQSIHLTLLIARLAPSTAWFNFQFKLVALYCVCTVIGLLLIYQLINTLTRKLRESDIQRMKVFSDIAHSHRLTTLGKLAAGVAHEINNPLASLHQRTGLLQDIFEMNEDFPQRQKVLKTTSSMMEHISRCQIITHQLLILSQEKTAASERTVIKDLISELLVFFHEEAEQRHIIFETNLDSQLPHAHGAEDKIQQVLLTIITNAMTAIEDNGIIRIDTKMKGSDYIKISIEDNGRGIPANTQKHVFDPFFTTKDTGEGTGLGLAIANALIKSLGGEIAIESKAEKGTLFSIILPKYNPNENTDN